MTDSASNPSLSLHHVTAPAKAGDAPFPGLLLLHGRGSNELDLLSIAHVLDPRLFVLSARAPFILGPDAYYWYDLEAALVGQPSTESIEYSLGLVHSLMQEATEAYPIDPNRFYVGGFSMGAAMSAATLLMYPEHVAGALLLSGYAPLHSNLPFRTPEVAGKPVFQAHGVHDEVIPLGFGRGTRDYLQELGVALTYKEYPMGHMVIPEELDDGAAWMRESLHQAVPQ